MSEYDVRIVFTNGTDLELYCVTAYGYDEKSKSYYVVKNGYKQFFNQEHVRYIGRVFDLDNKVRY